MDLAFTKIVIRQYTLVIGKEVKKYRIILWMIMNSSKKGKWVCMRIMGKDMSIYDIII